MRVLIAGTGLIGTSLGLALQRTQRHDVVLWDLDASRSQIAQKLGAGRAVAALELVTSGADHAVVAVPPESSAEVIARLLGLKLSPTVSDVSAVQSHLAAEVQAMGVDPSAFCGSHPMAGSEQSGPAAARADLFDGRAWAVTPHSRSSQQATDAARLIAMECGAVPVELSPQTHDEAVALVSHVPQLVASALAGLIADADEQAVSLAGQGVRDTTRIAASAPALWGQIVAANADHVAGLLRRLQTSIGDLLAAVDSTTPSQRDELSRAVESLIRRGNVGRSRLPGKHGARSLDLALLNVVVADEPGQLAQLLSDASRAGANVEDLNVEHALGRPSGVVQLAVRPEVLPRLRDFLAAAGWSTYA